MVFLYKDSAHYLEKCQNQKSNFISGKGYIYLYSFN